MFSLPFEKLDGINFSATAKKNNAPVLKRGEFILEETGDTYLDMSKWGKGCVWINGHNLGRYWEIGPQQTVYVPAEWLKKGKNELIVLELIRTNENVLQAITKPELNKLSK